MLFPTTLFAVFFVTVLLMHWGTQGAPRTRKWILLAASLTFYGVWSWKFALMLLASAVVNHAFALLIARGKHTRALLVMDLVLNLGILAFFKYTRFLVVSILYPIVLPIAQRLGMVEQLMECFDTTMTFVDTIILPVGISFFTFQALSYVIDVYRGSLKPSRTYLDFANYLAFFPQLVAGPIVRASDLLPQMEEMPRSDGLKLHVGRAVTLILTGLFKKMILANWLAAHLADPVFADPASYSGLDTLLGVYGYTLQIYCDFSAYSDIAIGVALLLGFEFPINFNAPYFSITLQEFWRRWHISLSSWLRDYLYIPLGGSRCGKIRTRLNLLITMLLGGLWHGAGWPFVLWGAFHGGYLSLERMVRHWIGWPEKPSEHTPVWMAVLGRLWIFHVVAFGWILFRAGSADGLDTVSAVLKGLVQGGASTLLSVQAVLVLCVAFGVQWFDGNRLEKFWQRVEQCPWWVVASAVAVLLVCGVLALAPSGVQPFIYFQF